MAATSRQLPLCLTVGDPTGIGPEITARWLAEIYPQQAFPLHVVGDIGHLKTTAKQFGWKLPHPAHSAVAYTDTVQPNARPGQVAFDAIQQAVASIAANQARGLVTGPISKAHLWQAGVAYPGHTEMLADLANQHWPRATQQPPYAAEMLFQYHGFRVLLLTRHVPLMQVTHHLTVSGVAQSITSLVHYLQQVEGIAYPRLCLLGVNPHAGEIGGSEETDILIPARDQVMRDTDAYITLPMAADGVFRGLKADAPTYHAYIAPTHDQGLIPIKLLGGFSAVNITIGLPFVRTSVSHGMAMDQVGTGTADIGGLSAAIHLANQLTLADSTLKPGTAKKTFATPPSKANRLASAQEHQAIQLHKT